MPNFNLEELCDILSKTRKSLNKVLENTQEHKLILAGDFNFHRKIVEWVQSEEGFFSDIKPGNTAGPHKRYDLKQVIDKPTRENNILDFVLTNTPDFFSECNIEILKSITDHNIVTLKIDLVS